MKRHTTKHIPTLLFAALFVIQIILSGLEHPTSAQPIPIPTTQALIALPQSTHDPFPTDDPYPTEDPTAEPTVELTPTETETPTVEGTPTEPATPTLTETPTPTLPVILSETPSPTLTETETPTATATFMEAASATPTEAPTMTSTEMQGETPSLTFTPTETWTPTDTSTGTPIPPTSTLTSTATWTLTQTATNTPVPPTPTFTPTPYALDCTYSVAPGDVYGTQGLIWAVNQANLDPNADTICLGAGSTYSLTHSNEYSSGLPPIRTAIALRGYNATLVRSLAARGLGEFRLLYVESTGILQIDNLKMVGGRSPQGGAIISAGNLTILNSLIDNNSSSSSGGGIYIASGTAAITNTSIQNNRSVVGGGIYTAGGNVTSVTFNKVTLSNNQATNTGGGLFNFNANVYINGSQFIGNVAPEGAGIRNQVFGQMWLSASVIRGNNAALYGGGLVTETRAITANNNCFISNIAPSGSSVYTPITTGTALNFEFNWWGRSTGAAPGEIYGNIDPIPPLVTAPANCKTLISR